MTARSIDLADDAATIRLGAALAAALVPGIVVHLSGELGAGKTTLARALIQALAPGTRVKSPTYTLVEPYELAPFALHHLDLYRIGDPSELDALDVRELGARGAVLLVEWPERGGSALPPADLSIALDYAGEGRRARLEARSGAGEALLERLGAARIG